MTKDTDWFVSWFNTPYYHILYKHRDDTEAQEFILNLLTVLKLKKEDLLLDLGCGKGRHAIFLNSLGFNVVGADLSKNSIKHAQQFENQTLQFIQHDMRNPFKKQFNAVLNLFTSFGFFEDDQEDINILQNIKNALKPGGIAVIDFMNVKKVVNHLVAKELKIVDGIQFNISRRLKNGFVVKEINFEANGAHHTYTEKVKCLHLPKIKTYLNKVGFSIKHIFGNYQLQNFDENTSDRLILVVT